ncbi:Non-heme dioxygenase N-terminal domain-containing protein [Artemisia annua]|uniref:Non-heme dioxygenase N-terminal domain-containing protein n=1 Tax=Artemisia annua TaxID=35608 RepID=A0A2U1L8R1_ARTAN|nr:Non-heme dioxygenase N-terminal domain-containing protein [Artemisia annua]
MSNGVFKSRVHRALVNPKYERMTLAMFCMPHTEKGIGPFLEKVRESSILIFRSSMKDKKKCLRAEDDFEGYGNDVILLDQQTLDWVDRLISLLDQNTNKSFNFGLKILLTSVFGLKPHADGTAITVLLQDKEIEGLQLLKDGQWVGVPIVRDALTINVGDQIEIMSNGVFKSRVHRALVNPKYERMTLAMFCMPHTEKGIGPVDELITDETPRLYKNVKYSLDFYFEH